MGPWEFGQLDDALAIEMPERQIPFDDRRRTADFAYGTAVQPDAAFAQFLDDAQIMADEQHSPSLAAGHLIHFSKALLLEFGIADREDLIDHEYVRLQMRSDGEGKANVH